MAEGHPRGGSLSPKPRRRLGARIDLRPHSKPAKAHKCCEEASIAAEADGLRGTAPRLDAAVTSLAVYAPVVVIGTAEQRVELSTLIDAGATDYVMRDGECLPSALLLIRSRLRQAQKAADSVSDRFEEAEQDFGEVLRHELNNPLTGILGNADLLLAEVHRKKDGKLPHGGEQRLETICRAGCELAGNGAAAEPGVGVTARSGRAEFLKRKSREKT